MEPGEYLDRVVRFLETKGWNISTTQIAERTVVVTGTRESDTYYDRMLTMVVTDKHSPLTDEHVDFLRDAAEQHDVDQMMATCRGGLDDDAMRLCKKHGVEFLEPSRIEDAFIDGFSVDDGALSESNDFVDALDSGSLWPDTLGFVGFYLLFAVGYAVILLSVELLAFGPEPLSGTILIGGILLASPLLSAVWSVFTDSQSPVSAFVGSAVGHLLFVTVLGTTAFGLFGSVGLFEPLETSAVLALLAIPVGALGAGTALLRDYSRVTD